MHYCSTYILVAEFVMGKGEEGRREGVALFPGLIRFYIWGLGTGLGGEVVLDKPCSGAILLQMFFNMGEPRWML